MSLCTTSLPTATLENGSIDVVAKFKEISQAALDTDSIYMRAKDTFKELFDEKKINEPEYAKIALQFVSNLASTTTQSAMNLAIQWAQQEKELAYTLALSKANTELAQAQRVQTQATICNIEKETDLKCAQLKATLASSIRENGRIATYDADGCTPLTLEDEGTKFEQKRNLEAQMYATLADAYRKSGVVTIGTGADGALKATTGDSNGYTYSQDLFAQRQTKSFEDSKRNHAANAVSQLIGQLVATEIVPSADFVAQWNAAISYLNTDTP